MDIVGVALSEKSAASLQGLVQGTWRHLTGRRWRPNQVQRAYGNIEEVPVSVLIDRRGRIRYRWDSERDFATFRAAVGRLLREPAAAG